jgi:hypothetical protein
MTQKNSSMRAPYHHAERALQEEIIWRLKAYPVLAVPIPNGIWIPARTDSEKAIVARIINKLKTEGFLLPGAPDLILAWSSGSACIELKRPAFRNLFGYHPAGTPSENQVEFARRATALGIHHTFCRSWDELAAQLAGWGVAPRR